MRMAARHAFMSAYGKARSWLDQVVVDPTISVATLAADEGRTERSIRQTLSLAFLDPTLVEVGIKGTLPRGLGLKRLMDLPPSRLEQWIVLGLQAPARS